MDSEIRLRKEQGRRLAQAREAAGYRSARAAALENNWPESTYRAHEAGTRTIGVDDAERYAKRFRAAGVPISGKAILFGADEEDTSAVSFQEVGRRVAAIRQALGLTTYEMAKKLGTQQGRLESWEAGISLIPASEALKLKRMLPGLSTDWIYDGDPERIQVGLADQLNAALAEQE